MSAASLSWEITVLLALPSEGCLCDAAKVLTASTLELIESEADTLEDMWYLYAEAVPLEEVWLPLESCVSPKQSLTSA